MLWLVLLLAAPALSAAATIYKRELPDGTVIYSDQPHPDAQEFQPSAPQTIDPYTAPAPTTSTVTRSAPPASAYRRVAITAPADDESVWNDDRVLQVAVAVEPPLRRGHRIAVLLDGQRVAQGEGSSPIPLHDVFRGTHELQAVVEDAGGRVVASGQTITFHMKQHSVLNPQRR
jgi:hypothetical protein